MKRIRAGKASRSGASREPLSHVLGTRAKVGCLRVLCLTAEPITQREAARRSDLQHRSAQLALDELVALGVVQRTVGGRDYLVALNGQHYLSAVLRASFRAESEFFLALRQHLTDAVGTTRSARVMCVVLFGSVARGEDRAGSDLDLLVIAADTAGLDGALARIAERSSELRKSFGYAIRPIGYTIAEARTRWRGRKPPLPDIVRDHIALFGSPLRTLLDG